MPDALRRLTAFVEERASCADDIDIGMPWKQFDLTMGDLRAALREIERLNRENLGQSDCIDRLQRMQLVQAIADPPTPARGG